MSSYETNFFPSFLKLTEDIYIFSMPDFTADVTCCVSPL
jgi:hypothetical protein